MDRDQKFMDGYRCATKDAVEWLHQRALEMNDPHAQQVLNSAAFNMGGDFKRKTLKAPELLDFSS